MMLAHDFIEDAGTRGRSVLLCFFCWSCGDTKSVLWPMGRSAVTNPRDTAVSSGVNIMWV